MHPDTIKKYWRLLEINGLIKYEGPASFDADVNEKVWLKDFSERRKNKASYYTIKKKDPYRIIPRETIDKLQNKYKVNENELKLYLMLANM